MGDLIDRQDAVNVLCDNCDHAQAICPHYPCKQYTKIEQLPSAQPTQPNTPNTLEALDCISRQDAVDIINGYEEQFNGYIGTPNDSEVYAYARGLLLSIERNISALTSAQPERKKGKWGNHGECPFCSYLRQWEDDRFCGNCGADMRGEQE